jgi:hypothetical protein
LFYFILFYFSSFSFIYFLSLTASMCRDLCVDLNCYYDALTATNSTWVQNNISCNGAHDSSYPSYPFVFGYTYRLLGTNDTALNRFRVWSDSNDTCVVGTIANKVFFFFALFCRLILNRRSGSYFLSMWLSLISLFYFILFFRFNQPKKKNKQKQQ